MQPSQPHEPELDHIDLTIITHLQEDATISNAELAKKIDLSPSACLGRCKRLKQSGVIRQFAAIVDERKVGLEVITYVFVSLSPHNRVTTEAFLKSIRRIPDVMECHNISGIHDYLLKIISPSINDYRNFVIDTLIEVPGVGKVETSVVLSTEKLSYQLPLRNKKLPEAKNY
ncbi:Lrp/AsnC family transcriptional regulator [Desulfobacterota bacterium M19]